MRTLFALNEPLRQTNLGIAIASKVHNPEQTIMLDYVAFWFCAREPIDTLFATR
jgi:hypothetical protein